MFLPDDLNKNVAAKKQGKKGEFAEPAARLIQAGGGLRIVLLLTIVLYSVLLWLLCECCIVT